MGQRHGTLHYSVIQGFFWMAYCAGTGFSSAYLLQIGFENARIGILIALSGITAAVLQPTLAERIDRSGKRLLKPVIFAGIAAAVLLSVLILLLPEEWVLVCGICFAGNLTVLQLLIPLINALSVCGREGAGIDFGFARAMGSLVYAGMSWLLGFLTAGAGMGVLSLMRIISFLALAVSIALFPVQYTQQRRESGKEKKTDRSFLSRYPGFTVMMAGCFFLYLCHSFLVYYNYQIVLTKGGDEASYGKVIALAAVLELPVMFGFSRMLKKASAALWFRLAGIGYILKALAALLARNMTAYFGVQIFQMLSWAMITVASVSYVKESISEEDSTGGQAWLTLSYTAAMAAGSLGGGVLLQLMDVRTMLLLAVLSAAVGSVILSLGIRRLEKHKGDHAVLLSGTSFIRQKNE